MPGKTATETLVRRFVLMHHHLPHECNTAFAAWHGFASPLRRRPAIASCVDGDHRIWWTVDAPDEAAALAQLPPYLAERTQATPVREVAIP